jgi:hypothetical protein
MVPAVEQWLAAQPGGDAAGLADGRCGGLGLTKVDQVLGVVEQAVGEVVGGGVLAQPGERRASGRAGIGSGEADAGQVAFGLLQGCQLPGPVAVEHGQQFGFCGSVGKVVGGGRSAGIPTPDRPSSAPGVTARR